MFAQFLDVGFVEFTFLVQDFGYDAFGTENWDQILLPEAVSVHQCPQDLPRSIPGKVSVIERQVHPYPLLSPDRTKHL